MIINNVKIILPDNTINNGSITVDSGIITNISENIQENENSFDANGLIAIPGLIDLHIHGAGGISVTDKDPDSLNKLSKYLVRFGITGFLWTTMAVPVEEMDFVMTQMSNYKNNNYSECLGINIEGSFISAGRAGSHLTSCIFEPNIELMQRWINLSNNNIRIVTIAPEKTPESFIKFLNENNIIPSIGHSQATYEQTVKSLEQGATYFTHLGNATGVIHQREPGIVGAALLDENSVIEIICDGFHLHSGIVKLFLKTKGWENSVLVSDGTCVMGMPSGKYEWYDSYANYDGESLKLENGTIAGGVQPLNKAIKNVMNFTNCSLNQAVQMTSLLPAKKLGIDKNYGSIEIGKKANIALISNDYETKYTFVEGKLVYSSES
jgi:N-acetylglucosamine-6-phosphate deacetylase